MKKKKMWDSRTTLEITYSLVSILVPVACRYIFENAMTIVFMNLFLRNVFDSLLYTKQG